jgi:two-component SAPR family response regulator
MKIKTLLLQDHSACSELIDDIIKAPDYDVFRLPTASFDELSMFIFTLQPDLIICEEAYRNLILNTEKKINKTIPIVFIGTSRNLSDQPQMHNRSTAYLTFPFKEEVLKAMINLLI